MSDRIGLDPDPDLDRSTMDRRDLDQGPDQTEQLNTNESAGAPATVEIRETATIPGSKAARFASQAADSKNVAKHGIPGTLIAKTIKDYCCFEGLVRESLEFLMCESLLHATNEGRFISMPLCIP